MKYKLFQKNEILYGLKISVTAIAAILLAQALQLTFAVSAGIVAILSVAPTKRETIGTAVNRLFAFIVALVLSFCLFSTMGVCISAFFVYLIIFVQICIAFRWKNAVTMDSVLISHFLSAGAMNWQTVSNEMMIFAIGAGFGIIANLHLKKQTQYIEFLKNEMDERIRRELKRMSLRIMNPKLEDFDGKCFDEMWTAVLKAKDIAKANYMNQLRHAKQDDIKYIAMREQQVEVLHQMYLLVSKIKTTPSTAQSISKFLELMANVYHRDNSGEELLEEFVRMDSAMKSAPLPVERVEFEARAQLYGLMRRIEEFIQIKHDYMQERLGA